MPDPGLSLPVYLASLVLNSDTTWKRSYSNESNVALRDFNEFSGFDPDGINWY